MFQRTISSRAVAVKAFGLRSRPKQVIWWFWPSGRLDNNSWNILPPRAIICWLTPQNRYKLQGFKMETASLLLHFKQTSQRHATHRKLVEPLPCGAMEVAPLSLGAIQPLVVTALQSKISWGTCSRFRPQVQHLLQYCKMAQSLPGAIQTVLVTMTAAIVVPPTTIACNSKLRAFYAGPLRQS